MPQFHFGAFRFDPGSRLLLKDDVRYPRLTPHRSRLLLAFLRRPAGASPESIFDEVWEPQKWNNVKGYKHRLEENISRLKKIYGLADIDFDPSTSNYILNCPVHIIESAESPMSYPFHTNGKTLAELSEDQYLPIYFSHRGFRRDEVVLKYQGEYVPPDDFKTLMENFPPDGVVNQYYSFQGWEGEIPSEDAVAGRVGEKLTLLVRGGDWGHVSALTDIWNSSRGQSPDPRCQAFRKKYLATLYPARQSPLYHNVNAEVLVVTADNQIVIARRKSKVVSAGRWTASLEEQMARLRVDGFTDNCNLFDCAERGARDELGIEIITSETRLLGFGFEFGNLTAAFLILIKCAEPMAEVKEKWKTAREGDEAVALDSVAATKEAISAELKSDIWSPRNAVPAPWWNGDGSPCTPDQWHPVAKARLFAYLLHISRTADHG